MSKHTTGPWKWSSDGDALSGLHGSVLLCPGNVPGGIDVRDGWSALLGAISADDEESEANANLIAAAPDLLEALGALLPAIMSKSAMMDKNDWLAVNIAIAAIAKARGEKP